MINNSLDHLIYAMNSEYLCKNSAQILESFLDFVLKEEVMIQDYDLKIADMIAEIQVEATFPDGTKLVTVHNPIR